MLTTSPYLRRLRGRSGSFFLAAALCITSVQAETFRSFESAETPDALRWKLVALLNKVDSNNFQYEPETMGFAYLYQSIFTSPFNYRLYAGTVSEKQSMTMIRLEGRTGDVNVFSRILEQEKLIKLDPLYTGEGKEIQYAALTPKYHWIGQPLNWVAPWLGVLHASYDSPRLTTGQTVFRFSMYFGIDAVLVWAAGRNFFRDKFNAQKYAGNIAAALFLPRVIGSIQSANLVRGHNRLVELKYTFPVQ